MIFWRPTPYSFEYYGQRHQLKVDEVVKGGDAWDNFGNDADAGRYFFARPEFLQPVAGLLHQEFCADDKRKNSQRLFFPERSFSTIVYYLSNGIVMHK
jgi:hypothetical protein